MEVAPAAHAPANPRIGIVGVPAAPWQREPAGLHRDGAGVAADPLRDLLVGQVAHPHLDEDALLLAGPRAARLAGAAGMGCGSALCRMSWHGDSPGWTFTGEHAAIRESPKRGIGVFRIHVRLVRNADPANGDGQPGLADPGDHRGRRAHAARGAAPPQSQSRTIWLPGADDGGCKASCSRGGTAPIRTGASTVAAAAGPSSKPFACGMLSRTAAWRQGSGGLQPAAVGHLMAGRQSA